MKTKQSFVTNSSSTSFVLESNLDGMFFKKIDKEIHLHNKLREIIPNIEMKYPYTTGHYDYTRNDANGIIYIPDEIDGEVFGDNIRINIRNGYYYNEEDLDSNEVLYISMSITKRIYKENSQYNINNILNILKKIKLEIVGDNIKNKFIYFQYISEFIGDGWGGDPMGPYGQEYDAIKGETFVKNIEL